MSYSYRKVFQFSKEVGNLLNSKQYEMNFRYNSLLLIKEHFDYKHISFVLLQEDLEENLSQRYLNNVTIGIPKDMIMEYYDQYYVMDPLKEDIISDSPTTILQHINEEEYVNSKFYKEFMDKYNFMYLSVVQIFDDHKPIAQLTFIRRKEEGLFLPTDLRNIKEIAEVIGIELKKALKIKSIRLENMYLNEFSSMYPIGQISLDEQYNVLYYNKYAPKLIGKYIGIDMSMFQHYFASKIIKNNQINDLSEPSIYEVNGLLFKIERHINSMHNTFHFLVFITNNTFSSDKDVQSNEYYMSLTDREKEIAQMIMKGYSNVEIGKHLNISPFTVKSHIQRMYTKSESNSRIELIYKLFIE